MGWWDGHAHTPAGTKGSGQVSWWQEPALPPPGCVALGSYLASLSLDSLIHGDTYLDGCEN